MRCGEEAAENALQRAGRGAYNKLYRPPLPAPCVHLFCEKINSTLNCPVIGQFQKWLQPSGDGDRTFELNVLSLTLPSLASCHPNCGEKMPGIKSDNTNMINTTIDTTVIRKYNVIGSAPTK